MNYLDYARLLPNFSHFLEISKTGSLSRASQSLHLTQSALSKSLDKLEKSLGVTLFDRRRGSITLNSDGFTLYHYTEQAFTLIDDALNIIFSNASTKAQQVAFAASSTEFIVDLLHSYMQEFPTAIIHQTYSSPDQLVTMLSDEHVDFVLSSVKFPMDSVHSEVLYEDEIAFLSPASHPMTQNMHPSLAELSSYNWLGCSAFVDIFQLLQKCGLRNCSPSISMESWELDFILSQLEGSLFLLPMTLHSAQNIVAERSQFTLVRLQESPITQAVILSVNSRKHLSADALVFLDYLRDYFEVIRS